MKWRTERPAEGESAPYYRTYIDAVPAGDIVRTLQDQIAETSALLAGISEAKAEHRYAPGKWSIKEVVGHLADAERVFAYRALRFARGDATPLASFDENAWVPAAGLDARTLADLAAEFQAVRGASVSLFGSLDDAAAMRRGTASGKEVVVRALAWISAGHERHHARVLRERYLGG